MLTLDDEGGRGVWQMVTLADQGEGVNPVTWAKQDNMDNNKWSKTNKRGKNGKDR